MSSTIAPSTSMSTPLTTTTSRPQPRYGQKRPGAGSRRPQEPVPARKPPAKPAPTAQDRIKEAEAKRAARASVELKREADKTRGTLTDILCAAVLKLAAQDERRKIVVADQVDEEIAAENATVQAQADLFELLYARTGRRIDLGLYDGAGFTPGRMVKAGLAEVVNCRLRLTRVGQHLANEFAAVMGVVSVAASAIAAAQPR